MDGPQLKFTFTPPEPQWTHPKPILELSPWNLWMAPSSWQLMDAPQKWKTEFSAITWNSHLHPMTSINPPQTLLWMAPMKFMDGPKSLTTYGWPRQAKNCILDYNIVVCINIQCCCMKPPKIYEWPPCSLWRPQKIYGWPRKFFVKNHLFFHIQTFFSPNKSPYMLYIQEN